MSPIENDFFVSSNCCLLMFYHPYMTPLTFGPFKLLAQTDELSPK